MIRMRPEKRATAIELKTELSSLFERCGYEKEYTTKKTKDCPPRAGTDLSSLIGNPTSSVVPPTPSSRGGSTRAASRVLTGEPVSEVSIAQEPEAQTKAGRKPAVLLQESTLVETRDPDTDGRDGKELRKKGPGQSSLEHRVSAIQGMSYRSEDMMEVSGCVSTSTGWHSDPEREPLVRRPGQGGEQSLPPATVWTAFLGLFC